MQIYSVILVSAILLLTAAGLLVSHVGRGTAKQQELDAEELDYRRRQFRRRMHTSATLGLLALTVLIGYLLTLWFRSRLVGPAVFRLGHDVDVLGRAAGRGGRLGDQTPLRPLAPELPGGAGQARGPNPPHSGGPGQWQREPCVCQQKEPRREDEVG